MMASFSYTCTGCSSGPVAICDHPRTWTGGVPTVSRYARSGCDEILQRLPTKQVFDFVRHARQESSATTGAVSKTVVGVSFAASATLIGSRFGCGRSAGSSTGRPNCIAAVRIGAIIPFYIRALLARPKLSKYVFDFPIDGIAIGHRPTQSSISGRFLHVQSAPLATRYSINQPSPTLYRGMGSRRKLERRRASGVVDGIDVRTILR